MRVIAAEMRTNAAVKQRQNACILATLEDVYFFCCCEMKG